MRIVIITPYYESLNRGNAVAVNRWARGFQDAGDDVLVLSLESSPSFSVIYEKVLSFKPQVIHGVHAYKSGKYILKLIPKVKVPVIVSMRGTDVWSDLKDPEHKDIVKNTLDAASFITVITKHMKDEIGKYFPDFLSKIKVIPQGIEPFLNFTLSIPQLFSANDKIILFPANIRKVKNTLYPVKPLAALVKEFPLLHLVYAGPVIEKDLKRKLDVAAAKFPWLIYLGSYPHDKMGALFKISFAVIGCSFHEGMPNAILEGMAMGKPVIVYNNSGTQKLIKDGKTGFLFKTQDELIFKLRQLLATPGLAEKIGRSGQKEVLKKYSVEKEIAAYRDLCLSVIKKSKLSKKGSVYLK